MRSPIGAPFAARRPSRLSSRRTRRRPVRDASSVSSRQAPLDPFGCTPCTAPAASSRKRSGPRCCQKQKGNCSGSGSAQRRARRQPASGQTRWVPTASTKFRVASRTAGLGRPKGSTPMAGVSSGLAGLPRGRGRAPGWRDDGESEGRGTPKRSQFICESLSASPRPRRSRPFEAGSPRGDPAADPAILGARGDASATSGCPRHGRRFRSGPAALRDPRRPRGRRRASGAFTPEGLAAEGACRPGPPAGVSGDRGEARTPSRPLRRLSAQRTPTLVSEGRHRPGLPSAGPRTPPAGAASHPANTTPHERAPRGWDAVLIFLVTSKCQPPRRALAVGEGRVARSAYRGWDDRGGTPPVRSCPPAGGRTGWERKVEGSDRLMMSGGGGRAPQAALDRTWRRPRNHPTLFLPYI